MGECSREETYLVIIEGFPDPAQLYHKCEEKAEYPTENICKTRKGREKEGGEAKIKLCTRGNWMDVYMNNMEGKRRASWGLPIKS